MDAKNRIVGGNRPGWAWTHPARCCRGARTGRGCDLCSGDPLLIQAKHKGAKVHVKSFNSKTVKVNKHVHVNKNVYVKNKKVVVARPYRAWVRRPYYGTYVAGVALGTISP